MCRRSPGLKGQEKPVVCWQVKWVWARGVGSLLFVGVLEVLPNVLCTAQWKSRLDEQRSSSWAGGERLHEANVCIPIPSVPISIFVEGWWRLALSLGLW